MRCHTIPKVLIKNWEIKKGKVVYFSFKTNDFAEADTKSLFTEKDLLTQKEENFYNQYIETPLSYIIENSTKDNAVLSKNFHHFRACYLLSHSIIERRSDNKKKLSDFGIKQIDSTIKHMFYEKNQRIVFLNSYRDQNIQAPIFLNELGFFSIDYYSQNTYLSHLGVPINKHRVLAIMEENAAKDLLSFIKDNRHALVSHLSIGAVGDKILIPPELLNCYEKKDLKTQLIECRNKNIEYQNNINLLRKAENEKATIELCYKRLNY